MNTNAVVTPLFLAGGAVLRIDRGRGTVVRAASGRVWITEHGRREDIVLAKGQRTRLTRWGRAIVSALRPARIVLEMPTGIGRPSLEIAEKEGGPGRRLAVAWPHVDEMLRVVRAWVAGVLNPDGVAGPPPGRHEIQRRIRRDDRATTHGAISPEWLGVPFARTRFDLLG